MRNPYIDIAKYIIASKKDKVAAYNEVVTYLQGQVKIAMKLYQEPSNEDESFLYIAALAAKMLEILQAPIYK